MRRFITLLMAVLTASVLLAQSGGKGPCGIILNVNNAGDVIYRMDATDWGGDAVYADFKNNDSFNEKSFATPNSLVLNGGVGTGWGDYDAADTYVLKYQVFPASETEPEEWTSIALDTKKTVEGTSNSRYEKTNANVDILALANGPGLYKFRAILVHKSTEEAVQTATFSIPGNDNLDFSVTVPQGTENCYLKEEGTSDYRPMTLIDGKYTLTIESVSEANFRYNYFIFNATEEMYLHETDENGNAIPARSFSAEDVVSSWQPVPDALTIKFEKPADWNEVNLWAWTDAGDIFAAWPGQALTEVDGWYAYTFAKKYQKISAIFSSGGASPEFQTVDIENVTSSICYTTDGTTTDAKLNVQVKDCSELSSVNTNEYTDVTIYTGNSFIIVETSNANEISLFSVDGKLLTQQAANSTTIQFTNLKPGIYIVKVDNKSYKVVV